MSQEKKINIAIVGLGFGAEFIPIYQNHPHANLYAICQRDKAKLNKTGDAYSRVSGVAPDSKSHAQYTQAQTAHNDQNGIYAGAGPSHSHPPASRLV